MSKKTFTDAASEMIHSCEKDPHTIARETGSVTQRMETTDPKQVIFLVDNADGVLESKDRKSFLSLLCTMCSLSKQKLTFDLPSKDVSSRLDPLSPEEARKVLISRVDDEEIREKLCKTERIVVLCGCVPLALCLVGSLLSDYTEDKIIKYLEQEPTYHSARRW